MSVRLISSQEWKRASFSVKNSAEIVLRLRTTGLKAYQNDNDVLILELTSDST